MYLLRGISVEREIQGFTLIELLAVLAIIAILAVVGSKGYDYARRQAKESRAKAELEKLRLALDEFRVEYGRYPEQTTASGFRNLAAIKLLTNSVEGIDLVDPWGRDYQYQCTNRFLYRIWSMGQNADTDADDIEPSKTEY